MKKVIVQAARKKPHCSPARLCILPAAGNSIYEPLSGCIGTPSQSSQLFELTRNDVKGTEIRLNRQCSRSQESEDRSAIVHSKIDTSAPSSSRSHAPKPKKHGSRVTCMNGSDGYRYGTWYCTSSWKYSNTCTWYKMLSEYGKWRHRYIHYDRCTARIDVIRTTTKACIKIGWFTFFEILTKGNSVIRVPV